MSASDSKLSSMEDNQAVEDVEGSLLNVPSTASPVSMPSLTPQFPTTTRPDFTGETVIESKAVSMASNDCSTALSSPAEASPAKPTVTSTSTLEGTTETSPATSHIASASDSLPCRGTTFVNATESAPMLSSTFGSPDLERDFPALLTFKGVTVTLENNSVWKQFYSCGTEMILTKPGRRMFPYCRYRLSGLDPERLYSLVLSIVPSGQYKYRWSTSKWEVNGPAEHQAQGLIRAFSHHYSPCKGSEWMSSLVSFYKLKLTNNCQDQDGHIILHSMHRYIPRLHVIPVPNGVTPTSDKPVVMGPESITFTFPQTEFMAVTTYQNFRITQLKINHNPFAKGFREDGNNPRLNRVTTVRPVVKTDTEPPVLKPEPDGNKEVVMEPSAKNHIVPASVSNVQETRLVLKPIMSNPAGKDDSYVPCIRGKHALGELVLVQKRPLIEPKEENDSISVTPDAQHGSKVRTTPKTKSTSPASSRSTPGSSPHKKRKRVNRRWANSRGRDWKATDSSPAVVHSPSLTVAMQPELDDVEGLLFVSFTSKEALEVHVRDKPATTSSSASPVSATTLIQSKQPTEVNFEEKLARLEATLLNDLGVLKHRQVIHPVLQAVGLKLSSLDPCKSIDLQYLGVCLPLPPKLDQSKAAALSPGDEGLPFISRTGKTSDMTKIKGWKNKFIRGKETSPNCDGLQKNLSAFCSNMLDEYLESEAQQISERAAAFSTYPEDSVAYQLPAKSSSYVKTLDSVLKHRSAASKFPAGVNRPCPLSHKPLLYSALTSPPPPLASAATPSQSEAPSRHQSSSSHTHPDSTPLSSYPSEVSQRSSTCQPEVSQRPAGSFGHNHGVTLKVAGLTKFQLRMLRMESEALNQGLNRTHLTPDRLSVALSVMLTKEMMPHQVLKVAPKIATAGPECGQEFCRLGCVCSSLQQLSRGPLHCRRPECMFGCACFKRKITKQLSIEESDQQTHPVYSMTSMEHVVQPCPGSFVNKLWERNIHDVDPEPLFAPKTARLHAVSAKVQKRCSAPRPTQPIREEDKDPVYKYFESMMTCARVREFNSKPPPEVIEPKITASPAPRATTTPLTTTDNLLKNNHSTTLTVKKPADKTSQGNASIEAQARKQVQIQSECQWMKDRTMVLEALCQRMNDNRLSRRFCVGPYCVNPVAKVFMQKPSGSIVTYRVLITKPSKASDCDEDELDDSEDDKHSFDGYSDADEDDGRVEEPKMKLGVTPFLSGVIPAGRLKARTKPVGLQAAGLIQVNGKSYNQARLLLGKMGSLHPANRLAAYVTGRLKVDIKNFVIKNNAPKPPQIKVAGTVFPSNFTAKKITALKLPTQQPGQVFAEPWRKQSISLPQQSQNTSTINPAQSFLSNQLTSSSSFQTSSTTSPVSLTVSPSLKSPSFLGQSGTYSFRICPPSNQGARDQKLPGVTLPGGFTLIQLPKPGADGAAQQSEPLNTTNKQKEGLFSFSHLAAQWFGLDSLNKLGSKSVEPGSPTELVCEEKMPTDESDEVNKQMESNLDIASDDFGSDSSDYSADGDEDDDPVDIETVEEVKQEMTIHKALLASRESSDDLGSLREFDVQDKSKGNKRRQNHTVLERLRRNEQRVLFDKLQTVLKCDPRTPRFSLLSMAVKEIHHLVKNSKCLEEKKGMLTKMQSAYVKKLSRLSGKSETLITHKLKEICDREKRREKMMKWRPVFSQLLQSKAALLQAIAPEPKHQPPPQPQSDSLTPVQANSPITVSKNNIHSFLSLLQARLQNAAAHSRVNTHIPTPQSLPQAASSEAAPSSSAGEHVASVQVSQHPFKEACGDPDKVIMINSQTERQPQAPSASTTLQVTAAQDGASPPNCNDSEARPPLSVTVPLIRSKTGRIILPSSLKPRFYTLVVVKAKEMGEDGEVSSSVDPASNKPLEDKSACSGAESLVKLAFINKSISVPKSESKPEPSPPVSRRQRGGPQKNPVPSVGKDEKPTVEEETRKAEKSEVSMLVEERQGRKMRAKRKPVDTSKVADNPVQVKRRRGRPPKQGSPVKQAAESPSISSEDSPVRLPGGLKDISSSRPLTRGALGKDFPSAKKRSWIDVEKELEPDVESE